MLHPHVPEELKHFGKHLFATFLGLLMAVGLESWHQEHVRKWDAREAYESLIEEVKANLKSVDRLSQEEGEAMAMNLKTVAWMEEAVRCRREGKTFQLPDSNSGILSPDAVFKTSSWSIAVSAQYLQRFPRVQAERLSDLYDLIRRTLVFQDQLGMLSGLGRLVPCRTRPELQATLDRMSLAELEKALADLRQLQYHCTIMQRLSVLIRKGSDEILQNASGH